MIKIRCIIVPEEARLASLAPVGTGYWPSTTSTARYHIFPAFNNLLKIPRAIIHPIYLLKGNTVLCSLYIVLGGGEGKNEGKKPHKKKKM